MFLLWIVSEVGPYALARHPLFCVILNLLTPVYLNLLQLHIAMDPCMFRILMLDTFQSLVSLLLTLNASRVLVVVLATGWGSYTVVTLLMKAMRSFLFTSITFATAQSFVAYMQVLTTQYCDQNMSDHY